LMPLYELEYYVSTGASPMVQGILTLFADWLTSINAISHVPR
jgi:hypothetical protein